MKLASHISSIALILACGTAAADETAHTAFDENHPAYEAYHDYILLKYGDNYSAESDAEFTRMWNTSIASGEISALGFTYEPYEKPEDYDIIWVNQYTSKAESTKHWTYVTSPDSGWNLPEGVYEPADPENGSVRSYYRFNFWDKSAMPGFGGYNSDQNSYHVEGLFCSFNENKDMADLEEVINASFIPYLGQLEGVRSTYRFTIEVPDFEADFDFLWKNIHPTKESADAGRETWASQGGEVQAALEEVSTCSMPYASKGLVRSYQP